jgi:hypothetical protein
VAGLLVGDGRLLVVALVAVLKDGQHARHTLWG